MAIATFVTTPGAPIEGNMNLFGGINLVGGRATFHTTDATCTTPPRMGTRPVLILVTGSDNCGFLTYAVGADGTITWTRSVTTSGGEFCFLVGYSG